MENMRSENLKHEEKLGGADNQVNLEILNKTDFFEDESESKRFLEEIKESTDLFEDIATLEDEFEKNSVANIKEALAQIKIIEESSGGKLVDKKEIFKEILDAMGEDTVMEGLKSDNKEPSLIKVAKNLGKIVKNNKKAFMAFAVFSGVSRLMSGEAEASEVEIDMTPEMQNYVGDYSDQIVDNIDSSEESEDESNFEELISSESSDSFKSLVNQIDELKNDPDSIFISEKSERETEEPSIFDEVKSFFDENYNKNINVDHDMERSDDFKDMVNELIKDSEESPQTVKVLGYDYSVDSEGLDHNIDNSDYDFDSTFEERTLVQKTKKNNNIDLDKGVEFSGIGMDPESALVDSLKGAAVFKGVTVETSRGSSNIDNGDIHKDFTAVRSEAGIDSDVTFDNVRIEEKQMKGHSYYEAKIISY